MVEPRTITTARAHYLNNLAKSNYFGNYTKNVSEAPSLFPNPTLHTKTTLPFIVKTKKERKSPFLVAIFSL